MLREWSSAAFVGYESFEAAHWPIDCGPCNPIASLLEAAYLIVVCDYGRELPRQRTSPPVPTLPTLGVRQQGARHHHISETSGPRTGCVHVELHRQC